MKLFTKGNWYYETQILMWVIMWQHDMKFKAMTNRKPGIRWGRLYIWYDTAWMGHGVAGAVKDFWHDLSWNIDKVKKLKSKLIIIRVNSKNMFKRWFATTKLSSFISFVELTNAGFFIGRANLSEKGYVHIRYRLSWNKNTDNDLPDISMINGHWNTMVHGRSNTLSRDLIKPSKTKRISSLDVLAMLYLYLVSATIIIGFVASFKGVWTMNAPELFGEGWSYFFETGDHIYGMIKTDDYWGFYGTADDCRIVQLTGERISDQVDGKVPCYIDYSDKGNHFSGWIDFRGHTRPFCGGLVPKGLPDNCYSTK